MSKSSKIEELLEELWLNKHKCSMYKDAYEKAKLEHPYSRVEVYQMYGAGLISKLEARKFLGVDK